MARLFVKIEKEHLPQVKSKYPFIYLEHGRLEVDDSSVRWLDSMGRVVPLPIATIGAILLGPGTSITHDAVRTTAAANCCICWVGEDSLLFYACGLTTVSDSRDLRHQAKLSSDPQKSLAVARKMFQIRFPDADLNGKKLSEMMGMEGYRVRALYEEKAKKYGVGWSGRQYKPGQFEMGDTTNKLLTAGNGALYSLICSCLVSIGLSPHLGFIHSGSPLPFVYDLADLYKEEVTIDLAFKMTKEMSGSFNKKLFVDELRKKVQEIDLLSRIIHDAQKILEI